MNTHISNDRSLSLNIEEPRTETYNAHMQKKKIFIEYIFINYCWVLFVLVLIFFT